MPTLYANLHAALAAGPLAAAQLPVHHAMPQMQHVPLTAEAAAAAAAAGPSGLAIPGLQQGTMVSCCCL